MELFDKKYVYFMWNVQLEGERGFTADDVDTLKYIVNHHFVNNRPYGIDGSYGKLSKNTEKKPFHCEIGEDNYNFAYYDPNYDVKWIYYKENKKVQAKLKGFPEAKWTNIKCPKWESSYEWRIQPEEKIVQPTDNLPQVNLENYINGFPSVINPCKLCDFIDANGVSHIDNIGTCKHCCWFYGSNFKAR